MFFLDNFVLYSNFVLWSSELLIVFIDKNGFLSNFGKCRSVHSKSLGHLNF